MTIAIEQISLTELKSVLYEQAQDTFPKLKDETKLNMLADKWHNYANFCISRNENKLVGIIIFYANQPESRVVYIPHIYVSPNYRGQNLMTSMLHTIEKYSKNKGFDIMQLEVNKTNNIAIIAYIHYGFTITGETSKKSYFMKCAF